MLSNNAHGTLETFELLPALGCSFHDFLCLGPIRKAKTQQKSLWYEAEEEHYRKHKNPCKNTSRVSHLVDLKHHFKAQLT